MLNIEAPVEPREGRFQRQQVQGILFWTLLLLLVHFISPILLIALVVYQCCCIRTDQQPHSSTLTIGITVIVVVYIAIAPLSIVTIVLYKWIPSPTHSDTLNAFSPLTADIVIMICSTMIALRFFSLADSYEPAACRPQVKRLEEISLRPPLSVCGRSLHSARDLFLFFRGEERHTVIGMCGAALAAVIATFLLRKDGSMHLNSPPQITLFVSSTIYFCGMFFVYFALFTLLVLQYHRRVACIRRLTKAIDEQPDSEEDERSTMEGGDTHTLHPRRGDQLRIGVFNMTHLWAWEECRRLAAAELTSGDSVLNTVLTPSMWFSVILITVRVIASSFFFREVDDLLSVGFGILIAAFLFFFAILAYQARKARRQFERQATIIAQKTFDVVRVMDVYYTHADEYGTTEKLEGTDNEVFTLPQLRRCYATLRSVCTYMIAENPSPLLFGAELKQVRFYVLIFLLITLNVFFISTMISMIGGECSPKEE